VGGAERLHVDVRVVAATHRDLRSAVRSGEFREDLYYRLAVTEIRLPPLRERREDVPLLVAHFLELLAYPGAMSEAAMALLGRHAWPGNVRELRNAVEAATVTARGGVILPEHLPGSVRVAPEPAGDDVARVVVGLADGAPEGAKYGAVQDAFERALLAHVLGLVGGNQVHASRLLGIHRTTLRKLIEKHGVDHATRK
jgi:two-component system nitrogen regulation response regulator GlnG